VTELGSTIVIRFQQSKKAAVSIEVTESGIMTDVRLVHDWNTKSPM
jgi:hypothetical protein